MLLKIVIAAGDDQKTMTILQISTARTCHYMDTKFVSQQVEFHNKSSNPEIGFFLWSPPAHNLKSPPKQSSNSGQFHMEEGGPSITWLLNYLELWKAKVSKALLRCQKKAKAAGLLSASRLPCDLCTQK